MIASLYQSGSSLSAAGFAPARGRAVGVLAARALRRACRGDACARWLRWRSPCSHGLATRPERDRHASYRTFRRGRVAGVCVKGARRGTARIAVGFIGTFGGQAAERRDAPDRKRLTRAEPHMLPAAMPFETGTRHLVGHFERAVVMQIPFLEGVPRQLDVRALFVERVEIDRDQDHVIARFGRLFE